MIAVETCYSVWNYQLLGSYELLHTWERCIHNKPAVKLIARRPYIDKLLSTVRHVPENTSNGPHITFVVIPAEKENSFQVHLFKWRTEG